MDVICAGILVADAVARPVTRRPLPGQLELVERISLHAGGSALNTGCGLARLGLRVALAGRVGRDGFGEFLRREAERGGCDTRHVREDPGASTSATLVTVELDGERAFLHAMGANAHLTAADVPLNRLEARCLHLAGYFILPGLEEGGAVDLFQEATRRGLVTSLDCVWDATGRWLSAIGPLLPHTDVFCPSLAEARAITGKAAPPEVAAELLRLGVRRAVALKMGPQGSYVASGTGGAWHFPAPQVETVDGTGAGDAFIAGFLAGMLRDLPLPECARLGNVVGAQCVTAVGATTGLPDWPQAQQLARRLPEVTP